MSVIDSLPRKLVRTRTDLFYGNPGQRLKLPRLSLAWAMRATNLPMDDKIVGGMYWLSPTLEEPWPDDITRWHEDVGVLAFNTDLSEVEQ